jgi:uncharacterized membrane protein YdjX (TVP38/TMEM64 family)
MDTKSKIQTALVAVLSILFVIATFKFAQADVVRQAIFTLGVYGPIIYILAKGASRIVVPVSGTPLYVLGALVWGPFYGSLLSFLGDMLGAVVSFLFSRHFGREWVMRHVSKSDSEIIPKVLATTSTTSGLIVAHFILIAFPDILNYTAGLGTVPFMTFLLVHAPFALISSFVVSYGSEFASRGGTFGVVGFICTIVALGLVGLWALGKYSKNREEKKELDV